MNKTYLVLLSICGLISFVQSQSKGESSFRGSDQYQSTRYQQYQGSQQQFPNYQQYQGSQQKYPANQQQQQQYLPNQQQYQTNQQQYQANQQQYQANQRRPPQQQTYPNQYSNQAQSNVAQPPRLPPLPPRPGQQITNRFSDMLGDDPNAGNNNQNAAGPDFTTRAPSNKPTVRPVSIGTPMSLLVKDRFDDIGSGRKLVWDPELSKNTEEFALTLFGILSYLEQDNIMISPYSIHSLLVLIAEGAGGNTFNQLLGALNFKSTSHVRDFHLYTTLALNKSVADVSLNKFAAIIGDNNRPVSLEYENIVEKIYDADYIPVNFQNVDQTVNQVNKLVSDKTNGQIRSAITRDELLKAQLILLSGLHFQGSWKSVFNKTFTKVEPFFDSNQERTLGQVNMMFQRGPFAYSAVQDIGSYILELPYGTNQGTASRNDGPSFVGDDRISMILVLPRKGLPLFEVVSKINKFGMERIFRELKRVKEEYDDEEVEVHIPRFETETSLNLVEALQNMHITDLFEANVANLSMINKNYYVSSVLHKTKIRVDEKGTEASAVTTSIFANKATPPKFHANRPFLYFIVDKATRLILFAGDYKIPSIY